jgi:hypothetical protein
VWTQAYSTLFHFRAFSYNCVHQELPNVCSRRTGCPRKAEDLKMLMLLSSLFPDDRKSRGDLRSTNPISVESRGTLKLNSVACSPQANDTDRAAAACQRS